MKNFTFGMIAFAALSGGALLAQDLTGTWQGTLALPNGKELRTVIKVTKADGNALRGTMFSIDQGGGGIPINPVTLQGYDGEDVDARNWRHLRGEIGG